MASALAANVRHINHSLPCLLGVLCVSAVINPGTAISAARHNPAAQVTDKETGGGTCRPGG